MKLDQIWKSGKLLFFCLLIAAAFCLPFASEIEVRADKARVQAQKTEEKTGSEDTTASAEADGNLQGQMKTVVRVKVKNNPAYNGEKVDGDDFLEVTVTEYDTGKVVSNPELRYTYYTCKNTGDTAPDESDYLKDAPVDAGNYWVEVYYKGDAGHRSSYSAPIQFSIGKATPEILFTTTMDEDSAVGDTIRLTAQLRFSGKTEPESNIVGKITFYARTESDKTGLIDTVSLKNGKAGIEYVLTAEKVTFVAEFNPSYAAGTTANLGRSTKALPAVQATKKRQDDLEVSTTHKIYGSKPFKLDISGGGGSGAYSYKSSNKKVATVAKDGTITILYPGTTYITVTKAGDDAYKEASVQYKLVVGKGKNPEQVKAIVKKDATDTSITVHTVKGQEYSADGGKTWNKKGVFKNLKANKEYTILTRLAETEYYAASSKTAYLKIKTEKPELGKVDQNNKNDQNSVGNTGGSNSSQQGQNFGSGTSLGSGNSYQAQVVTPNRIDGSSVNGTDGDRKVTTLGKNDAVKKEEAGKTTESSAQESEETTESSKAESEEESSALETAEEESSLSEEETKDEEDQKEQQMHASTATVKVGMTVLILALAVLTVIYFSKRETNL